MQLNEIQTVIERSPAWRSHSLSTVTEGFSPASCYYLKQHFRLMAMQYSLQRSPELLAEPIIVSCYAARSNNPNIVISCSAGILPARIIQIKCTTAYKQQIIFNFP